MVLIGLYGKRLAPSKSEIRSVKVVAREQKTQNHDFLQKSEKSFFRSRKCKKKIGRLLTAFGQRLGNI